MRILLLALLALATTQAAVQVVRLPEGAIQPQVVTGRDGTVHTVYYKGKPAAGDLFYARGTNLIQVNSQKGSAIAAGTIRGAQIALGKENRLHVIWNGGPEAKKIRIEGIDMEPLLYTRMNDAGDGFEPERNLITTAGVLDGGSSVAADQNGNVIAVWHGAIPGKERTEANRGVFVARSTDGGKTFAPEKLVEGTQGVCACCGLRAYGPARGGAFILYRAARSMNERPMALLEAPSLLGDFKLASEHTWNISMCPMSSASFTESFAAWETASQVYFTPLHGKRGEFMSPTGKGKRKHPAICANAKGEVLLAWSEDTSWAKGGAVAWQTFDAKGNPTSEVSRAEGLAAWTFPAVYSEANGTFTVLY